MSEEELATISARVKRTQLREVQRLASERGIDKSAAVRELLSIGIQHRRIEEAVDWVRRRKATIWKAAEHAQLTYREMLELLRAHNVTFPVSNEEIRKELDEIIGHQ